MPTAFTRSSWFAAVSALLLSLHSSQFSRFQARSPFGFSLRFLRGFADGRCLPLACALFQQPATTAPTSWWSAAEIRAALRSNRVDAVLLLQLPLSRNSANQYAIRNSVNSPRRNRRKVAFGKINERVPVFNNCHIERTLPSLRHLVGQHNHVA